MERTGSKHNTREGGREWIVASVISFTITPHPAPTFKNISFYSLLSRTLSYLSLSYQSFFAKTDDLDDGTDAPWTHRIISSSSPNDFWFSFSI